MQIKVWYHAPTDPCALLITSWVTIAVRGPFVLYFVGYPLLHLVMTIERGWATLRVHQYENASRVYGIISVSVVVGLPPRFSWAFDSFSGLVLLAL